MDSRDEVTGSLYTPIRRKLPEYRGGEGPTHCLQPGATAALTNVPSPIRFRRPTPTAVPESRKRIGPGPIGEAR